MQIRNLLPIVILLLVVSIAGGLILCTQFVILPGMERMEAAYAYNNLERGEKAIECDAEYLAVFVADWASWDDTYQFIEDNNSRYLESNLVDETFSGGRINYIIYLDTDGEVIYAKGFDFKESGEEIAVPDRLIEELLDLGIAGDTDTIMNKRQGLVALPESPVLIAAAPILQSNDTGPARGTLVMGRIFDNDEIQRLCYQINTDISIYSVSSPFIFEGLRVTDPVNLTDFKTVAISEDKNNISALSTFEDIGGKPAYVIRVDMSRDAFKLGIESIFIFLVLVLVIGAVSFLVIIVLVRDRFISRLEDLKDQIDKIREEQDFSGEISLEGDDELAMLSHSFDRMVRSLQEHIGEQKRAELIARIATEKLQLLTSITRHDILNQITVIKGHTDLIMDTAGEGSPVQSHIKEIEKAVENIAEIITFTHDYEKLGMSAPEWQKISDLIKGVADKFPSSTISVDIKTKNLEIFADPMLERVFFNLFDNTLRHAPATTHISVSFSASDGSGTIIYADNGPGVPYEMKDAMFEKGVGTNTGFGLFLSREILAITGITIHETGVPGKGAKFELRVPDSGYRFNENAKRQ